MDEHRGGRQSFEVAAVGWGKGVRRCREEGVSRTDKDRGKQRRRRRAVTFLHVRILICAPEEFKRERKSIINQTGMETVNEVNG